ncbi:MULTISPECIES: ABC transporter ATP-binding protein [Micromonospora]|uniref:ABC transporter ATP-binding protein n=1 Tax=Micromonospora sicca TaxID=2202420 RepID=A0A317DR67_9ACTN|nr:MULTISPECIES: ABC transporter ATP-binding protein [unclassified Micromonospora]MBM0226737.1 ABC transporter ATP-binding protein [Micromonospora sp. ATA51]PWR15333.1 ABC transporter ATP-binding protein [Micromonospora sp. 4G51]
MSLLEVEHLRVEFATEDGAVIAVKDVSFTLEAGEILALVGESGCGKSVTAMSIPRLLSGDDLTLGGSVRLNGVDLAALSERQMQEIRGKEISVVFQEPMTSLNPAYTVGHQIGEVLRRHEGLSRRQATARAIDLLELVGIPDPRRRVQSFPHQLSGGMRQRVMIAIAVACQPKVLLADEPTTALDVTVQAGVLDVIQNLRDSLGTAVILITHDLGVVADVADRVVVMYSGRRVEQAPVQAIFSRPQHPYTVGLLGALPARAVTQGGRRRLTEIPGMVPPPTSDPDECQFHSRCPRATSACTLERPPLGEVADGHLVACYHPGPGGHSAR